MSYDIIESDFNKKLSSAYQLSILAGMDSLVYFIFDVASSNALLLKTIRYGVQPADKIEFARELNAIFAREDLLGHLYRRVKVLMPNQQSILVPSRLYNDLEKTTYFSELTHKNANLQIQTDEIGELNAHIVYPADTDLMGVIKKQFPTCRFYSLATPYLLGCRYMVENGEAHTFFAHFNGNDLHLALYEKQNLQYYNTFTCAASSDALYYTLLAYNQFNLDPARIPLRLSGQILEDAEAFRMFNRYIANLRFIEEPRFLKFNRKFSEVPPHLFFDLYALALCK